jgi:NTP pyrophosphatase (non-canonical NTP hydrolase)
VPYHKQSSKTFEVINQQVYKHREERDWLGLPPRALAISIALEAAELLEHFQWQDEALGDKQAIADELADVLIYAFEFAQEMNIDMAAAIEHKLQKAAKKYPAEAFKNKSKTEQAQNWLAAKQVHRQHREKQQPQPQSGSSSHSTSRAEKERD